MMAIPDAPTVEPTGIGRSEGEGSSLAGQDSDALPNGVIAHQVTYYQVGPYSYTNVDDALAEHRRQTRK